METTAKHFDLFKKECRYWIQRFGLFNWRVEYFHEQVDDGRADVGRDLGGAIAAFRFGTNWKDTVANDREVKRVAFHEVCELLMSRLEIIARSRFVTSDEVTEARHAIIRRLENAFFEDAD